MREDLKKAHDLLNANFQQIVDALLDDYNPEPLTEYIQQLQRHEDEIWAWRSINKFEARDLYGDYLTYQDVVDYRLKVRKVFEKSIRTQFGDSVTTVQIVGERMPAETAKANEIFEEWEYKETLKEIAEMVSDDLSRRIHVAQDILQAIEDYEEQFGRVHDDEIIKYVSDMMFDEIDRVKHFSAMIDFEAQVNQMADLRQKFRTTRRWIQYGDYDTYII